MLECDCRMEPLHLAFVLINFITISEDILYFCSFAEYVCRESEISWQNDEMRYIALAQKLYDLMHFDNDALYVFQF